MRTFGLGPVFAYELLTTSRRPQLYAMRGVFLGIILIGLSFVWLSESAGRRLTVRGQALVGESFFEAMVGSEVALILLAAPAATAGAICLDKSRGALLHTLVTDLRDSEIVLGKLAARFLPVLSYVLAILPVMALSTLLGGIDPAALMGAFLVCLALGLLGCALALLISVWASKPHEVLFCVYAIWAVWLLFYPMQEFLWWELAGAAPSNAIEGIDPFAAAFGSTANPGRIDLGYQLTYSAALVVIAALLTVPAVLRMRPVAVRTAGRVTAAVIERPSRWRRRSLFSGPPLDANPVLWREWHRRRPSRAIRIILALYQLTWGLCSVLSIVNILRAPASGPNGEGEALVTAFGVSFGMLVLAVLAPTSLLEERVRGSLDVLMTTPIHTASIVWGKWLGTFRSAVTLVLWPVLISGAMLLTYFVRQPARVREFPEVYVLPGLLLASILAEAGALVALGLLLAILMPRVGRAVAATVTILFAVGLGWVLIVQILDNRSETAMAWSMASPFWNAGLLIVMLQERGTARPDRVSVVAGGLAWTLAYIALTAVFLWTAIGQFDRRLGRATVQDASADRRLRIRLSNRSSSEAEPAPTTA